MFGTVNNRKSIIIREGKRFCRNPQFNSDFPKQLSGIIDPDEFQQSIDNINRACRPTLCENLLVLCLFLSSLVGLIVFIAGISVIWLSVSALWIPLMSIGFVLFMGFFITAILVSSQIYRLCDTRLDKAIDAESRKYSMKLPVPTRWRLDMTIYTRHNSDAGPTYIQYFILIDIGERAVPTIGTKTLNVNSNLFKSTSYPGQQYSNSSLLRPNPSIRSSSDKTLHIKEQSHIHSSV